MKPCFRTISRYTGILLILTGFLAQAQTTQLAPFWRDQLFSNTGAIANGYKVCSYKAGTSTPLNTFTDSTGATPNANPVILDSTGSGNIWLTPGSGYKLVLMTAGTDSTCSTGTVVKTVDQVFVQSPTGVNSLTVGASIASAATIAPTAPITHVTGTTAITTITAPSQFVQTGYGGCLTLIPDGLWTIGTSGNVAVAVTAVVSQPVNLCYDNATSKWYTAVSTSVPKVRAYNSANQSIPNNTTTALTFDTNDANINSGSIHSTSVNTSRFMPATAGAYAVVAHVSFGASSGGTQRLVQINKNGSTYEQENLYQLQAVSTVNPSLPVVALVFLNGSTDYIEVDVLQDSGGALNVSGGSAGFYTSVSVYQVP